MKEHLEEDVDEDERNQTVSRGTKRACCTRSGE